MSSQGDEREEILQDILAFETRQMPSDLGQCVAILSEAMRDLDGHLDCATGDLQKVSADLQTWRMLVECAIRDNLRIRNEIACIRGAAHIIRGAIRDTADVGQKARLADSILKVLSGDKK